MHSLDVVHGDVKPSNVLLGLDGRARLIDFGIAHRRGHGPDVPVPHGAVLGSPAYLAPEVLAGGASTPAVDVHALGLVMLEPGARPRLAGSVQDVPAARRQPMPLPAGLDLRWRDLLAAMTAAEPLTRPSMRHLARVAPTLPERPWRVDIAPLPTRSNPRRRHPGDGPARAPRRRRLVSGARSLTGLVLDERYEIGEPVAVGGSAAVHRARDRRLRRDVAKVLLDHAMVDPDGARFAEEARHAFPRC